MAVQHHSTFPRPEPAFSCPVCRMTSHHPEDIARGYCGNCHAFTSGLAGLAEMVSQLGIAGSAMMAPDGPLAGLHNALVRLADDVEAAAVQTARIVTGLALLAEAETSDEMHWVPGMREW